MKTWISFCFLFFEIVLCKWQCVGGGIDAGVGAMVFDETTGDLYAGGKFSAGADYSAKNVAKWDGFDWTPLQSGTNDFIRAMVMINDELIVGGAFSKAGNLDCKSIAVWKIHEQNWNCFGDGNVNATIGSIAIHPVSWELYIGGKFRTLDNVAKNIASWNGYSWVNVGQRIVDSTIFALAFNPWTNDLFV